VMPAVDGWWPASREPVEEGGGGGTPLPGLESQWLALQLDARG
jgi:hypothetical protein